MRRKIKVTPQIGLNLREGPGTNYRKISAFSQGTELIVNDIKELSNGQQWYKLEDGRGWVCHKMPGDGTYTSLVADLSPPPEPPKKTPDKEPPKPDPNKKPKVDTGDTLDYDAIQKKINNDGTDLSQFDKVFGSGVKNSSVGVYTYDELKNIQNDEGFPPVISRSNGVNIYNYFMDHSFVDENLKKIRNNLNISEASFRAINSNLFTKFNRFKIAYPDYHLPKTFAYVFFTRPDLNLVDDSGNILKEIQKDPTYYYLYKNNPNILLSLTRQFSYQHDFHPFLCNTANSFELSDEFIKTTEHGETFTGYKVMYGKHNIESKTAGTFNISYTDDQEFSVYKTHKAWIDYISKVYRGELLSKDEYIRKKVLDYACSVYYILCGPDGETILFWSKYFGVFPTNAPSSTSSWSKGNFVKVPEYNITYAYAFKEDFSPLTLAEFNMNSNGDFIYRKTYEPGLLSTGKTLTGAPFIDTVQGDGAIPYTFKLKFRN